MTSARRASFLASLNKFDYFAVSNSSWYLGEAALKDLRSALLLVLRFHGPFRISELLGLQAADVTIHNRYLGTCPHALVCRYFASTRIENNSSVYIFRATRFFKKKNIYLLCPNRLSYSRARELINKSLWAIEIDSNGFSTHSLRAGGATFIAQNLPRSGGLDRFITYAPGSLEIRTS